MTKQFTNKPFDFISLDGGDPSNNIPPAEVRVRKSTGVVSKIDVNEEKGVANVSFRIEGLKHPIHGWVGTKETVFELAKTAFESKEPVEFRIEAQRKFNIDRQIPIAELTSDMESARESVRNLLVGINGQLSSEAVTHPSNDYVGTGGRYVAEPKQNTNSANAVTGDLMENFKKAAANPNVHQKILDAMIAQLILNGYSIEEAYKHLVGNDRKDNTQPPTQQAFAYEAPTYKMYNSDGRLNLGSGLIAAGVGIETLVYSQIVDSGEGFSSAEKLVNLDEAVEYFSNLILNICDRIQVVAYGQGFNPDRTASSHVRVRGIVYDIVKTNGLPYSLKELEGNSTIVTSTSEVNNWTTLVGKEGVKRFHRAIRVVTRNDGWAGVVLPESMGGVAPEPAQEEAPTDNAPVQKEEPVIPAEQEQPNIAPETTPVEETPTVEEPVIEPQQEQDAPQTVETPANVYVNHLTPDMVEGEELATPEQIENFKNLFSTMGYDISDPKEQSRIQRLITFTFGENYSKIQLVPDVIVEEFVDYYQSLGAEALDTAIRVSFGEDVN